jgi:hypothetical protein
MKTEVDNNINDNDICNVDNNNCRINNKDINMDYVVTFDAYIDDLGPVLNRYNLQEVG